MSCGVKVPSRVLEILLTAALAASGAIPAFATETHQFDVPSEDAPSAIRDFASQAHVQILVAGENVKDKHFHAVSGELSTDQGLRLLLADSGLAPQYVGDRSIAIVAANSNSTPPASGDGSADKGDKRNSFPLAQANQGAPQRTSTVGGDAQSSSGSSGNSPQLTEILVTAQKKTERLQDVPVPVTVLNTDALAENNQVLLRDYYATVPGLNIKPNIEGNTSLIIRGISASDFGNPTVGVLIDDVPYGGSTGYEGNEIPDLDPGDLERIEVLRGPQGTLYGVDSMGGLVKFVTRDPSTDGYSGRIEGGVSSVYNGAEPGYNFRASANIPLDDTLAIRVSGFKRQDPGYIDNPGDCDGFPCASRKGVNEAEAEGGRLAALWRPIDIFSLKFSALYQNTQTDGLSEVVREPSLGDLQQNYLPGIGAEDRQVQAYSLTMNIAIGPASVTSVTGYNATHYRGSLDGTPLFSSITQGIFGVPGTPFNDWWGGNKISQELRLSMPFGQKFDWLFGGFYTHETSNGLEEERAETLTGTILGLVGLDTAPTSYTEYAGFTDLTYRFSDEFDVQVGGRESKFTIDSDPALTTGPLYGATSYSVAPQANENAFTYLATARYKPSADIMAYLRLASGYRAGGPNPGCNVVGFQCQYTPDKTNNYELGVKGDFLDRKLSIDASLYYINWQNIQIQLTSPAPYYESYESNGSGAKSQGLELAATLRPGFGLSINGWFAYDDAVLTKPLPAATGVSGVPGEQLPNSSRYSGNVSAEQEFPLWGRATGYVGGTAIYVGQRESDFAAPGQREDMPAYTKLDFRTGVKYSVWTFNAYVNNATDIRGVLNRGIGNNLFPNTYVIVVPRTVGVSFSMTF